MTERVGTVAETASAVTALPTSRLPTTVPDAADTAPLTVTAPDMSTNATDAEAVTSDLASNRLSVNTLDAVTALLTSRLPTTVPDAAD